MSVRKGQRHCYKDSKRVKYLTICLYHKDQNEEVHKSHVFCLFLKKCGLQTLTLVMPLKT